MSQVPHATPAGPRAADRRCHQALDALLERVRLHQATGRAQLILDTSDGGIRAIRIQTDEAYRPPD